MNEIEVERLARAIASTLCRDGYIDYERRDGCEFFEWGDDQGIRYLAQFIKREYERNQPRVHPHGPELDE